MTTGRTSWGASQSASPRDAQTAPPADTPAQQEAETPEEETRPSGLNGQCTGAEDAATKGSDDPCPVECRAQVKDADGSAPAYFYWEFEDRPGDWRALPKFYSNMHEGHLRAGRETFEYDTPYAQGTKAGHYTIDLINMMLKNLDTGARKAIRRMAVFVVAAPPRPPGDGRPGSSQD